MTATSPRCHWERDLFVSDHVAHPLWLSVSARRLVWLSSGSLSRARRYGHPLPLPPSCAAISSTATSTTCWQTSIKQGTATRGRTLWRPTRPPRTLRPLMRLGTVALTAAMGRRRRWMCVRQRCRCATPMQTPTPRLQAGRLERMRSRVGRVRQCQAPVQGRVLRERSLGGVRMQADCSQLVAHMRVT